MSFTSWLIVIAVIALCVGPVMMFQPSARDRRLAALRAEAIAKGARVALGSGTTAGMTRYLLPWRKKNQQVACWQLMRKNYSHPLHLAEYWALSSGQMPAQPIVDWLVPQLEQLPDSVGAVELAADGVALYWREEGDSRALEPLLAWLNQALNRLG